MLEEEKSNRGKGLLELTSRVITLEDFDEISIWGPFEIKDLCYTYIYQNKDTRNLDERFELDGHPIPLKDKRLNYKCNISNPEIQSTMSYWVRMAQRVNGNFIGFREDELKEEIEKTKANYFNLNEALSFSHDGSGPYLIRKIIEGHPVLFPRNLPIKK